MEAMKGIGSEGGMGPSLALLSDVRDAPKMNPQIFLSQILACVKNTQVMEIDVPVPDAELSKRRIFKLFKLLRKIVI